MGVSDFPVGPTVNLVAAYLIMKNCLNTFYVNIHLSLPNSDANGSLCSADGHGGDADPARQQLVGHRQEPGGQRHSLSLD